MCNTASFLLFLQNGLDFRAQEGITSFCEALNFAFLFVIYRIVDLDQHVTFLSKTSFKLAND
jgi:hypothetical protein